MANGFMLFLSCFLDFFILGWDGEVCIFVTAMLGHERSPNGRVWTGI